MVNIVLVDDEAALRSGIARFLRGLGYTVHEASDGSEVARVFETVDGGVDLVITDINMPETDGLEVIRELRRAGARVPVIAVSGGGMFSKSLLLTNAEALGATVTLEKPFPLDELRGLVEEMLSRGPR